jgi:hypothetical protein
MSLGQTPTICGLDQGSVMLEDAWHRQINPYEQSHRRFPQRMAR